jgi:hypothetical protein
MELLVEADAIFDRFGNRPRHRIGLELLRLQAYFRGDLDGHDVIARQMHESATGDRDVLYERIAVNGLLESAVLRGVDRAGLGELWALMPADDDTSKIEAAKTALNEAEVTADDAVRVAAACRAGRILADLPPTSFGMLSAYTRTATLMADLADSGHADAEALVQPLLRQLRRYGRVYPIGRPRRDALVARRANASGSRSAHRRLRGAVARADAMSMPIESAFARIELARALDPGPARTDVIDTVVASAATMGAHGVAATAEALR